MSINAQKKEGYTVELEIAVSADELKSATDRVFHKQVKSITVPGFRKGKAPRKIIEQMYGEGIFVEDAVNELYPKAYQEAIDEAGLEPVAPANIEILEVNKDTGFTFKAIVTVKPDIEVGSYKGIAVDKTVHTIGDDDVGHELLHMQEHNARIVTVEGRAAAEGDTAVIDFEGFVDGVPFAGGKGEGHSLELGSGSFIAGFEEQIIGRNAGDEFDVSVTFPEEYHAEELKGKPALFKTKIHELKEKQLPELDDEFAKDVSEFDTLDELKADLRRKMQETRDNRSVEEMETRLVDAVVAGVTGDIPEVMYENKMDEMVQDFEYRLRSQGMNMDLYLQYTGMDAPAFRESFKGQAERQVKMRLALEKISALENLIAVDEEVEEEYNKLAERYQRDVAQIKLVVPAKDVRADLACNKAVDLIKEHAKITEVPAEKEECGHDHKTAEKAEAEEEKPKKKPAAKKTKKANSANETVDSEG